MVVGLTDKTVKIYDITTGKHLKSFEYHNNIITSVDIKYNKNLKSLLLLTSSKDGQVLITDFKKEDILWIRKDNDPNSYITSTAWSQCGQ